MANFNIDYLVVAGGGGGSNELGGGGGAGGYLTNVGGTAEPLQDTIIYTVVIGDGGRGGVIGSARDDENTRGGDGDDSSLSGSNITTITSTGGGGGGALGPNVRYGRNGGSGGGAAAYDPGGIGTTVGLGNTPTTTPSQGNDGGYSYKSSGVYPGGGGGGAGAVGGNYSGSAGGNGGVGLQNDITGAATYYAGGGGGNGYGSSCGVGTAGVGGNGGGGNSGIGRDCSLANGYNGTDGLGGGGGSATYPPSTQYGGSGGSGIVILRYTTADIASYTTTGTTPTADTTTISGQTILSFTTVGTGTITFTTPIPPIPPFSGTRVTNPVTGFESPVDIGLKLPSGTNDNLPTAIQGMIRNDTSETTGSSASAIIHYNGADWKYFAATESADNPNLIMYLNASDTTSYPGTGTTWFDLTSNGYDGTISNSTWNPTGYFPFNGSSSIVRSTALGAAFSSQTTLSIAGWFQTSASTARMTIASFSNTLVGSTDLWIGLYASENTIAFRNSVEGASGLLQVNDTGGSNLRDGNWHHVVFTADSNGTHVYVDGSELSGYAYTFGASSTNIQMPSINQFSIGANQDSSASGGQWFLNGNISKVNVYNTALTSTEVNTLFLEGKGF